MRSVLRFSRIIAQEAIISETTMPAPVPWPARRNGRSVTPDIGARMTGVAMRTPPPRLMAGSLIAAVLQHIVAEPVVAERHMLMIWANYRHTLASAIRF